jgi:hypothetical protein
MMAGLESVLAFAIILVPLFRGMNGRPHASAK